MIFEFVNPTKYLKAYIAKLPKHGHGEARRMADHLGVSSTYISLVLSEQKQLSPEQAELLNEYLGHSELEAEYFFYLVQQDRAGTLKLKKFCQQKLDQLKTRSLQLSNRVLAKHEISEEEKSIFYSHPIYSAVHLYTSIGTKGKTQEEIANRFSLAKAKTSKILEFLFSAGLIIEKDGRYSMSTQSTHLESASPYLHKHHSNWRLRAIGASEELSDKELMYTVNVSLSEKDFESLREEMVDFIKKFLKQVHESPAEEIACLNLDWFWIRK